MQRALIIGASGGIGAALAAELSTTRELDVVGLSRSVDGLDVTDQASVQAVMGRLDGAFDLIIVASGILAPPGEGPEKALRSIRQTSMQSVMAVNAIGPALVLAEIPRLLPRDRRSVVAVLTARVGSIGDNHLGGWYAYRASKAAANQIVHTAAIEISRNRPEAVVVALHPGTVETAFTQHYPGRDKASPEQAAQNLLRVIDGLTPAQSGQFFDWAGEPVPW